MHGGPKHGPYYARYWWQDGRRYKRYVRQQDAQQAAGRLLQTVAKQSANGEHRAEASRQGMAEVRALIQGDRAWRAMNWRQPRQLRPTRRSAVVARRLADAYEATSAGACGS